MLKILKIMLVSVVLLSAGTLHAATSLHKTVRAALENELYPFTSVVPGYERPVAQVPSLAVAEFRVSSDYLDNWSRAVAEILRYKIQYVPSVRLLMPAPYFTDDDARTDSKAGKVLLTNRSAFVQLNKADGIQNILTGSVDFVGGKYQLTAELVDAVDEAQRLTKQWQFTPGELPTVLSEITLWVYSSLGVALTPDERAYIEDSSRYDARTLEDFISLYAEYPELKGPLKRDKVNQLVDTYPGFPVLAIYALHSRVPATNLDEGYKNLERYKAMRDAHPGNVGVAFESYLAMDIEVLPRHVVADRLNAMKTLVKDNPHDPQIMITLGDQLVGNGNTLEAITVMLEAVERWPGYHRAWWSLGWALNQHAWQVRGNSTWRDVPERAKKTFKSVAHLSDRAIDEALKLNPYNGRLWNMKISSMGSITGYSDEMMTVFDKAVKLAPNVSAIYDSALNFSADRWGGNVEARRHIIEMALTNNPDEAWATEMRARHAADFDTPLGQHGKANELQHVKALLDNPLVLMGVIFFAVLFIVLLFVVVYLLGRRSNQYPYS